MYGDLTARPVIKVILKHLGSLRLTLALLIGIAGLLVSSLLIPQKKILTPEAFRQWEQASPMLVRIFEFLGLTDLYRSPITGAVWLLFFLNLAIVLWQRVVPSVRRKISVGPERFVGLEAPSWPFTALVALKEHLDGSAIMAGLARAGYRVYGEAGAFYAVRNRYSPLATIFFHASFFIILIGALLSTYSRFSGVLDLAEGETFTGDLAQYNVVPAPRMPVIGSPPMVSFLLLRVLPEMQQGVPTSLAVELTDDGGGTIHRARVNKPYVSGTSSFVIKDLGVAPLVVLSDAGSGAEIAGGFFKLDVMGEKTDMFNIRDLLVTARFYPDHIVRNGMDDTASMEIRKPAFNLTVMQDERVISRATLRVGETIRAGEYLISIPSMRYWIRFLVVKEFGVPIVYAGFGIAMLALVWRLVFFRREVRGQLQQAGSERAVLLSGRAEFYQDLFEDEFQDLVSSITSERSDPKKAIGAPR